MKIKNTFTCLVKPLFCDNVRNHYNVTTKNALEVETAAVKNLLPDKIEYYQPSRVLFFFFFSSSLLVFNDIFICIIPTLPLGQPHKNLI